MTTSRTFVAVELPGLVRRVLTDIVGHLRHLDGKVRWVAPENVHLTLKFLGDIEESALPDVIHAIESVTASSRAFTLKTRAAGGGPHAERARVIWVHVDGDVQPLNELQVGLEDAMEALGFARERRKFMPHLTLGRARKAPVALPPDTPCPQVSFMANRVTVFRSELRPDGAVYTALGYGELKGP